MQCTDDDAQDDSGERGGGSSEPEKPSRKNCSLTYAEHITHVCLRAGRRGKGVRDKGSLRSVPPYASITTLTSSC